MGVHGSACAAHSWKGLWGEVQLNGIALRQEAAGDNMSKEGDAGSGSKSS